MKLICGDSLEILKKATPNSVDAIVTDPPYGLSFMGKKWDYDVPSVEIWKECYRVLKPGGYLLSFAGTRTQHRMAVNIEDAGFEIRDMIAWVYGSGFPKSLNIGKAVDKLQGNEREKIPNNRHGGGSSDLFPERNNFTTTKGNSEWEGWGTATKPAVEPITISAKPLPPCIIYAIMGIELTNNLCQKSNVSAKDAELVLKSIQQVLEKAGVNSVAENARTLSWENIESVVIAAVSSTSQRHTSKEKEGEIKEHSAQENVSLNGNNNLQENSILTGEVDNLSEQMDTLLSILVMNNIDLNTISLWKSILEDVLERANTFTIETALKTITAWKTYNSLLSGNTQNFTSPQKNISPSLEPITVARKPLSEKTVAENVLKWGTGGINIDGSRVEAEPRSFGNPTVSENGHLAGKEPTGKWESTQGRFPANLVHDGSDEVVSLFPQTKSGSHKAGQPRNAESKTSYVMPNITTYSDNGSSGSAARFFYCAKASKADRDEGLEGFEAKQKVFNGQSDKSSTEMKDVEKRFTTLPKKNNHPTVKPTKLMQYLVKLVTPKGGVVLDPFMGSGSTGKACKLEGFDFIGIEREPEYVEIAKARIENF